MKETDALKNKVMDQKEREREKAFWFLSQTWKSNYKNNISNQLCTFEFNAKLLFSVNIHYNEAVPTNDKESANVDKYGWFGCENEQFTIKYNSDI